MPYLIYLLSCIAFFQSARFTGEGRELPPTVPHLIPSEPQIRAEETYLLGPGDQILIASFDIKELDGKPLRVDFVGEIDFPLVGRTRVTGLTLSQLKMDLTTRLKTFVNDPDISISLTEMHSQPISVLGSVLAPGVYQLQGTKSLFEVLSLAGGLHPDAGYRVNITRREEWGVIPLPGAARDATGKFFVASVSVKSIMGASNPEENIAIKPNDVISVPRADIIYVIGAVHKSGGFVMGENESLSALQILALAEGLDVDASPKNAKIMRMVKGTETRAEIPVNLKQVLQGKGADIPLKASDILFVPTSATRSIMMRSLAAGVQVGTGLVIYRR